MKNTDVKNSTSPAILQNPCYVPLNFKKMQEIIKLINDVKQITKNYSKDNVYKERFIDNELCLYYSVSLFGSDDRIDLQFYIEYYKQTKQLRPIICNTRDYVLYETLNMESVITAINKLKNGIK